MATKHFSDPTTMSKPIGFAHVVDITGPGRTIYVAGQLGIDTEGKVASGLRTHAAEQKSRSFDTLSAGPSNVVAERPSRCQVDDACNFNDRLSQLGTKESDVYREAGQQPLEQAHDRKNFAFRRAAPSG
jgi:hypothetical protein